MRLVLVVSPERGRWYQSEVAPKIANWGNKKKIYMLISSPPFHSVEVTLLERHTECTRQVFVSGLGKLIAITLLNYFNSLIDVFESISTFITFPSLKVCLIHSFSFSPPRPCILGVPFGFDFLSMRRSILISV